MEIEGELEKGTGVKVRCPCHQTTPQGVGSDPDCPFCFGTGTIDLPLEEDKTVYIQVDEAEIKDMIAESKRR